MIEQYSGVTECDLDCLDSDVKRAKIQNKARVQEMGLDGVQSDNEILNEILLHLNEIPLHKESI